MYLNTKQLARRWGLSLRTLQQWRTDGIGPPYVRIGVKVMYRQTAVERFEQAHQFQSTSCRTTTE